MPISTPSDLANDLYEGDANHFQHVLEHLFIPAINAAGMNPVPPSAKGSEIIHAEIVSKLASSDCVLCDMSSLNPNVFFELGIRTALNKPTVLVVDDRHYEKIPFDLRPINHLRYNSRLRAYDLAHDLEKLEEHLRDTVENSGGRNAIWKAFVGHGSIQHSLDDTVENPLREAWEELVAQTELRLQKAVEKALEPSPLAKEALKMRDDEGFFTVNGINALVRDSKYFAPGERIKGSLLVLSTSAQHTWLVATNSQIFFILDDDSTRAKERLIQRSVSISGATPVSTRAKTKAQGVFRLGNEGNYWYYSLTLLGEPAEARQRLETFVRDANMG